MVRPSSAMLLAGPRIISPAEERMVRRKSFTDKIRRDLTLIVRHITVLSAVRRHEPIGTKRLSDLLGPAPHQVRYTLRLLEQEGLVKPSPAGAVTTSKVREVDGKLLVLVEELKRAVKTLRKFVEIDGERSSNS